MPTPLPSPVRALLLALDRHLQDAGVVRSPGDALNQSRPPLWVEPREGVPAPGDKIAPERDAGTVLGMFYSGGVPSARWEIVPNIDVWIRVKGNQAMLRAPDLDAAIRDALLGDLEFRENFLLAPGTDKELRVISATLRAEFTPMERSEQAYSYITGYTFEVYRVPPG